MKQWVAERFKDWFHTLMVYFSWSRKMWLVHMEYRLNALLGSLGSIFWIGVTLLTYSFLFRRVKSLAGWSWPEMVLLYGVYNLWWGAMNTFFNGGLGISRKVRLGRLDKDLLRPGRSFFYAAMKFEPELLIHALTGVVIFIAAVRKIGLTFDALNLFLFTILLINSLLLVFFVAILFGSTAFWFVENRQLADFFWIWEALAKYPREFFSGSSVLYGLVHSLLPIVFIVAVPTEVVLGRINWVLIPVSFLITIVFALLARKVWRLGLKRYAGVSV